MSLQEPPLLTLAELREQLAAAEGRAIVNGRPYRDRADIYCQVCLLAIDDPDEVRFTQDHVGLLWEVTVRHATC